MKCCIYKKEAARRLTCALLLLFLLCCAGAHGFASEGRDVGLPVDGVLTVEDGERIAGFPSPDEAEWLAGENDPLLDDRFLYAVRFICAALALFWAGLYLWWKKWYGSGSS